MQKCAKNEKEIQQNGAKMKKSFQMFARAVWKDKLILCGVVVFLGVLAVAIYQDKELWFDNHFIKYCDALTIVFAFIAMIFAFRNFISAQKGEQIIGIFIEKNGQKESLPLVILHKNFTRAELFGALQTINQREKFNIAYLKTMDFFESLLQIQAKKSSELIIKLSPNDSFDFDKNAAV